MGFDFGQGFLYGKAELAQRFAEASSPAEGDTDLLVAMRT
jgi:hypothetical protein